MEANPLKTFMARKGLTEQQKKITETFYVDMNMKYSLTLILFLTTVFIISQEKFPYNTEARQFLFEGLHLRMNLVSFAPDAMVMCFGTYRAWVEVRVTGPRITLE